MNVKVGIDAYVGEEIERVSRALRKAIRRGMEYSRRFRNA